MSADEIEYPSHQPDYDRLRRETADAEAIERARRNSPARENVTLPEQTPAPRRDVAAEIERDERDQARNDVNISARRDAGLINAHEAHNERVKFENAQKVAMRERDIADKRRELDDAKIAEIAKENAQTLARQAKEFQNVRSRYEATGQNPFEQKSEFEQQTNHHSHERARFDTALKEQGRDGDLYGSQQRAAVTEYSHFTREQNDYEKTIRASENLNERNALTAQKQIRANDYIAYTSERIANQSERLEGTTTELSEKHHERQQDHSDSASQTRKLYQERYSNVSWETFASDGGQTRSQPDGSKRESGDREQSQVNVYNQPPSNEGPTRPQSSGRGGRG